MIKVRVEIDGADPANVMIQVTDMDYNTSYKAAAPWTLVEGSRRAQLFLREKIKESGFNDLEWEVTDNEGKTEKRIGIPAYTDGEGTVDIG